LIVARITVDQLLDMPLAERIELAQAIWDSVARNPEDVPLTDVQRQELDRRLEEYERNPNEGSSWESIKRSLR
jgi:putative addiction module component (TIGR02574 family)